MRVERLGGDTVRFFLTMDDLLDRGIEKEDMWSDVPKVHDLFQDMMEHAYEELGFEIVGPLTVEVFGVPAQGVVVIVSRSRSKKSEELDDNGIYELEVVVEESQHAIFQFSDLEHLIQAARRLSPAFSHVGRVLHFQDQYYLLLEEQLEDGQMEPLIALLMEYGESSTMTEAYLKEYGTVIWKEHAIDQIVECFGLME